MQALTQMLRDHEPWLMRRILQHAKRHRYTRYTSTLEEAWRMSISGLTDSIVAATAQYDDVIEFNVDENYQSDPVSAFGVVEAVRHRKRGVTLIMFLGLMKYYRRTYLELLAEEGGPEIGERERVFVDRCFDRFEIAFCHEWSGVYRDASLSEMQVTNRLMTNEKNRFLTAFESVSDPVFMLDADERVVYLNQAASVLIDPHHVPGGHYYRHDSQPATNGSVDKRTVDSMWLGRPLSDLLPWLAPRLAMIADGEAASSECEAVIRDRQRVFEVKRSAMLDVSEKLDAIIVILRDITDRKITENDLRRTVADLGQALSEVKRLSGLLPICASCKKVRDDKGYWLQVEQYISRHSEATFSHGICPDCVQRLYPHIGQPKSKR